MENILGAMDQVTAPELKDWMFTPDQMELPSMERRMGVWFLMMLGCMLERNLAGDIREGEQT
jgi:hypothetical protein